MTDNKRIARNTVMLYIRMVVLMLVNLYASRVVLGELGVEDYGLYSIVGAVVVLLGFINISMAASSQRFLSFCHGKGDREELESTFSSVVLVQWMLAGLVLVIGETAGIVYIGNFLNVAPEKVPVAHVVYQFSLFSFIMKILTVPYHASIIANEKMNVFAWFSIVEACLQLAVVFLLKALSHDKLTGYALMMFVSVSVVQLCYRVYCMAVFSECKFRRNWNKATIQQIFSYSGWNLLGSLSAVAIDQGVNMVLNTFFGVVVNAARGIAFQVSGAVAALSGNFQQALNPRIVKTFAGEEKAKMLRLIMDGTRFCYYLLWVLSLPVLFNMHALLEVWLGNVPAYTEKFCRLVLINSLLAAFSGCLMMGVMATGNIRKYQVIVASVNLLNIPVSIIGLSLYRDPYVTVYIMIALSAAAFMARLVLAGKLIGMSVGLFVRKALIPPVVTTICSVLLVWGFDRLVEDKDGWTLAVRMVFSFIAAVVVIAGTGVTPRERSLALNFIKRKITG